MGVRAVALVALLCMLLAAAAAGKELRKMAAMTLASPAFADGGTIPAKYTCDGADISPPLQIGAVPDRASSLALIVDDPDAPVGTWVHWVVWGIPAQTREIGENSLQAVAQQGRNDWKRNSYGGPCPPSGTHRTVRFRSLAEQVDVEIGQPSGVWPLTPRRTGQNGGPGGRPPRPPP